MKLRLMIPIAIGLVLTAVIIVGRITDNAYAAASSSGRGGHSVGSLGQSSALGGASGVTTGAGSNVGGVDRHLFCNMGVITPICK
jgi:hypothetical protein